jgi:hypothetical protein
LENLSLKYLQFREEFSHLHSHPGKIVTSMEEYLPLEENISSKMMKVVAID